MVAKAPLDEPQVVEAFDVVEDRRAMQAPRSPGLLPVDQSRSRVSVAQNDSMAAVSKQSPVEPNDRVTPSSAARLSNTSKVLRRPIESADRSSV